MSNPISDFIEPVQVWLGDRWADRANSGNITAAIRYTLNAGKIPGCSLASNRTDINGDISAQNFARIVLYAVRTIALPDLASGAYKTRGWEEKWGEALQFILNLDSEIAEAEGVWFATWQDVGMFMRAHTGSDTFWQSVVGARIQSPFRTVTLSAGGVISTGSQDPTSDSPPPTPVLH